MKLMEADDAADPCEISKPMRIVVDRRREEE